MAEQTKGEDDAVLRPTRVFVVHGRDLVIRDAMFDFLGALGLRPIEWEHAVALTGKGSPYIGEVLDAAFGHGQAVVVLLTPDDTAYLRNEFADGDSDPETRPLGQARPNVLFEAGMAMGRNPERTILVEFGELRPFSDMGGRLAVRMNNTGEKRRSLAGRLRTAGCRVDDSGTHWLSAGDFTLSGGPIAGLPIGKRMASEVRRGPSVDGAWHASGGTQLDQLKVTNNGPVPLFDVMVHVPDSLTEHVRLYQEHSVAKLPSGKSFTVRAWTTGRTMGGIQGPPQFELTVIGHLEDGSEFRQDIYLDSGG
ncbi:MAG: hypothetical protein JWM34_486 [Ilumatobacteraceae bacterium]|nr:hypothetical protein [Ilumatobacteraceae bacterium]